MPEDDAGPKPHLRIVPEPDDATRARLEEEARAAEKRAKRDFAERRLRSNLVALATNVLRIVRGAGRPEALAQNCADVLHAVDRYREAFDTWPPAYVIGEELRFEVEQRADPERVDYEIAVEQMIRGALQFVASSKLHQIPQFRGAEHELLDGARRYVAYQEKANAAWDARWAAERKAKAPAKKRKRRKEIEL